MVLSTHFDVGEGDEVKYSELPALEQLEKMGYKYKSQAELNTERKKYQESILYDRLEKAIQEINDITESEAKEVINKIHESNFRFEDDFGRE